MVKVDVFAAKETGFSTRFFKYWVLSGAIAVGLSLRWEGFITSHLIVAFIVGVMLGIITTTMKWEDRLNPNATSPEVTGLFDFLLKALAVVITATIIGVVLYAVLYVAFFQLQIIVIMLASLLGIPL